LTLQSGTIQPSDDFHRCRERPLDPPNEKLYHVRLHLNLPVGEQLRDDRHHQHVIRLMDLDSRHRLETGSQVRKLDTPGLWEPARYDQQAGAILSDSVDKVEHTDLVERRRIKIVYEDRSLLRCINALGQLVCRQTARSTHLPPDCCEMCLS